MDDEQIVEWLHTQIHGLRMIPKYKPSAFEFSLSKLIADEFQNSCHECKAKHEQYKYAVPQQTQSFFGRLFG